MEYSGKIVEVGEIKSGTSKTGKEWRSRQYVMLDASSQREKHIAFEVFGDKLDEFDIQAGDNVTVTLDLESRVWNQRWFTNVRCVKCEKEKPQQVEEPAKSEEKVIKNAEPAPKKQEQPYNDLPF